MKLFRRGDKKKEAEEQYGKEVAEIEQNRPVPEQTTEEMVAALNKAYLMMADDRVTHMLCADEKTAKLYPAYSPVNRTTKINKEQAEIREISYRILNLIAELDMNEDSYENSGWAFMESLGIFADCIITDQLDGHKGILITEQVRRITAQIVTRKKGWLE